MFNQCPSQTTYRLHVQLELMTLIWNQMLSLPAENIKHGFETHFCNIFTLHIGWLNTRRRRSRKLYTPDVCPVFKHADCWVWNHRAVQHESQRQICWRAKLSLLHRVAKKTHARCTRPANAHRGPKRLQFQMSQQRHKNRRRVNNSATTLQTPGLSWETCPDQ